MIKSCDNCYFRHFSPISATENMMICNGADWAVRDKENNICKAHTLGCISCSYEYLGETIYRDEAKFTYKGKQYCELCLANELGIEIKEVSYNQYYSCHGDYLGDDNNMTLEDILLDCSFVESLGE